MKLSALKAFVNPFINQSFLLKSRIHQGNTFFLDPLTWIKREDELSSGITGSKYRKYRGINAFN